MLEASVGSVNACVFEEEEDVTAVSLPVSVLSPNIVLRLSEDSGSMTSDRLLNSDILVESLSKYFSKVPLLAIRECLVCQASSASPRTTLPYTIPVKGMQGKICPWLWTPQFFFSPSYLPVCSP